MTGKRARQRRQRGHAVIEIALMAPWIFLLFLGVFDFGFYAYAAIATANAARVAVLHTSSDETVVDDSFNACKYALWELNQLPNTRSLTSCGALPVIVTAAPVTVNGEPASRVSVTYQTVQMFPIPGLMGRMTITRTADMRLHPPLS